MVFVPAALISIGIDVADKVLEELFVSSEVQTARDRIEDYAAAEMAAETNPDGDQELEDLRQALVEMPGAVRMLLEAIDRAAASAGEPQYDPGDRESPAPFRTYDQ